MSTALTTPEGTAPAGEGDVAEAPWGDAQSDGFPILEEPAYRWSRDALTSYEPTAREVLGDVIDGIDPRRGVTRLVPFLWEVFYVWTAVAAAAWVATCPTLATAAIVPIAVAYISVLYNTVWYHRYCSHRAFRFARPGARLFFLWTNPLFFREESYALPHHAHHTLTDGPGDPYGPHIGRLATLVSFETEQRTNTSIPAWRYRTVARLVSHIGFPINGYEEFKRTQSVEPIAHFLLRATAAQAMYALGAYAIGGARLLLAWYTGIFVFVTLLRDFNWHGHGGRRAGERAANRPGPSRARNQAFYGLVAGEWHGHHHLFPRSARAGWGPWQPDAAFVVIRLLHRLGIVASYRIDAPSSSP
jgi:stearoyl-CoA desaturase (delta-9 desaturase)